MFALRVWSQICHLIRCDDSTKLRKIVCSEINIGRAECLVLKVLQITAHLLREDTPAVSVIVLRAFTFPNCQPFAIGMGKEDANGFQLACVISPDRCEAVSSQFVTSSGKHLYPASISECFVYIRICGLLSGVDVLDANSREA